MPRIFAPNEEWDYNQGAYPVVNGAFALPATATAAIAYFTAEGFDVDTSKNSLEVFDTLTRAQLNQISLFLKVALVPADDRHTLIRKIETAASALLLTALTVTSVAHGTTVGNTVLTVTVGGIGTADYEYYYKADATVPPVLLYGDEVDSTWTLMISGDAEGVALTTGHEVSIVEVVKASKKVLAWGTDTVASKGA